MDFIYPQFHAGIQDELADPNVKTKIEYGGDYEGLYFQQADGPFADPIFRQAFAQSIDVESLFQQVYIPIAPGSSPLTCGPIVPGRYCDDSLFKDTFDPEGAAKLLEDAGWTIQDKVVHLNAQGRQAHPSRLAPGHEDWWLATNGRPAFGLDLELPVVAEKVRNLRAGRPTTTPATPPITPPASSAR